MALVSDNDGRYSISSSRSPTPLRNAGGILPRDRRRVSIPTREGYVQEFVQKYYGELLEHSADLKTNACCTIESTPDFVTQGLEQIHEEVRARYYGCGLLLPEALEGCRILDLGCGSGRDCYLLSKLAGEGGKVVGVDMTEAQLEVAQRHRDYHADQFGYSRSNVEFHHGWGPMTAADVAFSYNDANSVTNPESIHGQAGDFAPLIQSMEAIDDTSRERITREAQAMGRLGSHKYA